VGAGSAGAASFTMTGACTLSGDVAPGQSVLVQGSSSGGVATVTAAAGFTNAGTITLQSINSGWESDLTVTGGTLTNAGTLNVNAGTGGPRTITANLTNNGTVSLNTSTTFAKASGTTTNTGTFTVAAGQTLTMAAGGQSFNQNGGTLTVAGTLGMAGGT